ncbi:MAG: hypothetical protein WBB29_16330 [Geitlerinemataceae cyanobacterium]
MSIPPILQPDRSYTFRSYFEMTYEPEDILAEFGYSLQRTLLDLARYPVKIDRFAILQEQLQRRLTFISLTSEAARREMLIAPILVEVAETAHAQLRIEYPLTVSEYLKGSLDYYLYTQSQCLVVKAKHADLARGFTQLAMELIALAQRQTDEIPFLVGAVTTGDIWQFGKLDRNAKQITQGTKLYVIPDELETLLSILVAVLVPQF